MSGHDYACDYCGKELGTPREVNEHYDTKHRDGHNYPRKRVHVRKTFDCDYGKHALVMPDSEVKPLFGRIDVLELLDRNGGRRLHPSRVHGDYVPVHAKGTK